MDVLALVLYGVIFFPNIENFVDYGAINAFVAYKTQYENHVVVVLAEVFGTLDQCYELKRKKILCCLLVSTIFKIFTNHTTRLHF